MTERKHFKQLVRARMAKTGERYAAARRQILHAEPEALDQPKHPFNHFAGSVPVATALRTLLAHAGVRAPHTGQPFSEAMLFGIGGGIGAGVFAFHYTKEDFSSFFIAGRHLWQDDQAWLERALERLGLSAVIEEAGGAKAAESHLTAALEHGRPVVAWVDAAGLPYRGLPARWDGGAYHLLTVYRIEGGDAVVGDLADEPIRVPLAALTRARLRIKKFKARLLALEPAPSLSARGAAAKGPRPGNLAEQVRSGLDACVKGLTRGKMKNFTLDAFAAWADRLHGSKAADAWSKVFPRGKHLFTGLWSMHHYIEYYYTGGGLCRSMFADFLHEAGAALANPALTAAGDRYAELGNRWSALASAALPKEVPAFARARDALATASELYHAEGARATNRIRAAWDSLDAVGLEVAEQFPLGPEETQALLRDLQSQVRDLHAGEVAALHQLQEL